MVRGTPPWVRAAILVAAVVALGGLSVRFTGQLIPQDADQALLFQSSLLLVVLGSLVLERFFTAPGDALVNSLTGLITVLPFAGGAHLLVWLLVAAFLALVLIAATVSLALQNQRDLPAGLTAIQEIAFRMSSTLGRARLLFSVVFLASIFFFVESRDEQATALLIFWGIYVAMWPLGLPQLLGRVAFGRRRQPPVGTLMRFDSPNLARLTLNPAADWPVAQYPPLEIHLPSDAQARWGIPLFVETRPDGRMGTALLAGATGARSRRSGVAIVAANPPDPSELLASIFPHAPATLVGLVREGSNVMNVRFELIGDAHIELGSLVAISTNSAVVYYQVIEGETSEEPFSGLNYGSRIASAVQIGEMTADGRFTRYQWVPNMNAPVFSFAPKAKGKGLTGFTLGTVPGTEVHLGGDFVSALESHTALLGVTGSGKTELAFELIRYSVAAGVKVICIDLTSQYAPRLTDLSPSELSISSKEAEELGEKLFDADTGKFGGGEEKKVLASFASVIREDVERRLKEFLAKPDGQLGLIELQEISNTKATLWITEIYLSSLLKYAKEGLTNGKVLVVVEEAHTVMPEASFAGLGDFDSKGTIAKITQLALQGRKYGVGLLVVAQRTATVSKTVLTQCNTVISFSCIDDTSVGFLRNVYGSAIAEGIPALKRLRAVAAGPWINADVPIVFDVPYDEKKASRATWADHTGGASGVKNPVSPGGVGYVEPNSKEEAPF